MLFGAQRIHDMMLVYNRIVAEERFICMNDVYRRIAEEPAPRFYVSPERAVSVVAMMLNGGNMNRMRPFKRDMFSEIYKRALKLGAKRGMKQEALRNICAAVVRQKAPKFYMSPGSVKILICKHKKQWYNERLKKRLHFL